MCCVIDLTERTSRRFEVFEWEGVALVLHRPRNGMVYDANVELHLAPNLRLRFSSNAEARLWIQ
jgi:hypothetical protein